MCSASNAKPYVFFDFHMKFLTFLFLWPKDGEIKPNAYKRIESYYFIIVLMPNSIPLTWDILCILSEKDVGIATIIESLLAFACIIGGYYMGFCFILNRKLIKRLIEKVYNFEEFTKLEYMIATEKKATLYSKVLVGYSAVGSLVYVVMPLLSVAQCEEVMTKSMIESGIPCGMVARVRLPIRYDNALYYFMYGHQIFLVFNLSWLIIMLTMLLCGILMQATNHLRTLSNLLIKLSEDNGMITEEDFNFCVRYHISIIKYCDDLNEAFGSQMMIHISLTSFIISILGFELLMVNFTDFIRFSLHLLGWLCLLLLVCYYGQTLIDEVIEMNSEDNGKPYVFFDFQIKFLTFLTVWPKDGEIKPNAYKRLDSYCFIIIMLPTSLSLTWDILCIISEEDVGTATIIESVLAIACIIGGHYMGFCFILKRKLIKGLIEKVYNFEEFAKLEYMIAIEKKATLYSKVLTMYSTIGSLVYVVMPLLSIDKCEEIMSKSMIESGIPCGLVVRVRLPIRHDNVLYYFIYGHQVFLVFTLSWLIIMLTMLLCGILMQATNHLKAVSNLLIKFSDEKGMLTEEDFNFCLRYHISIIKYCDDLNEAFGSQMVIHVSLTSFIISILVYELLMVHFTDFIRFSLHLLGWLCLLLLVCYYGQTLIDESENVAVAVYTTKWYNSSVRVQKDIKLMLMRAQKPITLNALNMGFMSLATFLKVMSSAYSYLTLLINIK